jgi:hypothetical protein
MNLLILCLVFSSLKSGEAILSRLRENQKYESSKFTAEIEIRKGKRVLKKAFSGLSQGENFYIEFTNPEDRGVEYLKLKKDLYIYLPDIDDVVRISGDMLKQSFMGSDLSYEDIMEEDPLRYYKVKSERDTLMGTQNFKMLELIDTTGTAPYYRVIMFVDTVKNIWIKEELYTKSGRKIKEVEALECRRVKGKYYPVSVIMRDLRLKDSYTKFFLNEIDFDITIPTYYFKTENLRK